MFYTGASLNKDGVNVQSIGCASSLDLMTWDKSPAPPLQADPRWFETFAGRDNGTTRHFVTRRSSLPGRQRVAHAHHGALGTRPGVGAAGTSARRAGPRVVA